MKKLFTLALFLLPFLGFGQSVMPTDSATGKILFTEVVQVPGVSKDELYSRGREWFATHFNSAEAVLEMDDKESGKLIGTAFQDIYVKTALMPFKTRTWYMIKLYLKDGRYKYEVTNLVHQGYYDASVTMMSYAQQTAKNPAEYMYLKKNAIKKNGEMKPVIKSYYENDTKVVNDLIASFKKSLADPVAAKKSDW